MNIENSLGLDQIDLSKKGEVILNSNFVGIEILDKTEFNIENIRRFLSPLKHCVSGKEGILFLD